MNKAELHSAFFFTCDTCGRDNFVRAHECYLGEDVAKRIKGGTFSVHYDSVDDGTGHVEYLISRVAIAPKKVECGACGTVFESELYTVGEESSEKE